MIKTMFFLLFLGMSAIGHCSEHQVIDTLGTSPKGQFVALEEYGYKAHNHSYYVSIRVINVWTKEYVGLPIELSVPAHRPQHLHSARQKAKLLAKDELQKFNISG